MSQFYLDLIVVSLKSPKLRLSEALPIFARLKKKVFSTNRNFFEIDFYPISEFFLVSLKFSFLLNNARCVEAQLRF